MGTATATTTVEWVGEDGFEEYHGLHDGQPLTLRPGEPVDVSSELAGYLSENFGHLVSLDGQPPATKTAPAAPAADGDEPPTVEALMKLKRDSLDDVAAQLGIDPSKFETKRDLATAVVATLEDAE